MRRSARIRCDHLVSVVAPVKAGEDKLVHLERSPVADVADQRLLCAQSSRGGVSWWFVNDPSPAVDSDPSGPMRELWDFEATTERPWSVGSLPALVLRNLTDSDASVSLLFACGVPSDTPGVVLDVSAQLDGDGKFLFVVEPAFDRDRSAFGWMASRRFYYGVSDGRASGSGVDPTVVTGLPFEVADDEVAVMAIFAADDGSAKVSGGANDVTFYPLWITTNPQVAL